MGIDFCQVPRSGTLPKYLLATLIELPRKASEGGRRHTPAFVASRFARISYRSLVTQAYRLISSIYRGTPLL